MPVRQRAVVKAARAKGRCTVDVRIGLGSALAPP